MTLFPCQKLSSIHCMSMNVVWFNHCQTPVEWMSNIHLFYEWCIPLLNRSWLYIHNIYKSLHCGNILFSPHEYNGHTKLQIGPVCRYHVVKRSTFTGYKSGIIIENALRIILRNKSLHRKVILEVIEVVVLRICFRFSETPLFSQLKRL